MTRGPEAEEGVDRLEGSGPASTGSTAFWLHVVAWTLFYLTVVVAWGQRNSWPAELLLCILSVPLSAWVVSTLFKLEQFGLAIEPKNSQQEQLIAALVLAVGLASGQVLLMSLGLVSLGIAWLRPARPGVDWAEWLKIPVVFLTALPFWLDFEGSRLSLAALFDDPVANPLFHLPLALNTTQARIVGHCGLLAMVLFLRGRAFWLALVFLPVFLVFTTALPRAIPDWMSWPPLLRAALPWLVGAAALSIISRYAGRVEQASRALVSGDTLRRWFEGRRYPPWLAVLVVAITQALPLETVRLGPSEVVGLVGLAVLALLLLGLRARTPKGPIHSRSVAMVAGGLALTLVAEFTTNEHLRHVALAFVMVGLISWHCFWPLRVFVIAGLASLCLLATPEYFALGSPDLSVLLAGRLVAGYALVGTLGWIVQRPLPQPGARGYNEEGWIPPKRFALILLSLMMLFQTASAFWPEHEMEMPDPRTFVSEDTSGSDPLASTEPGWHRIPSPQGPVQLLVAYPTKNPYLLESPERNLRRRGWQVIERVRTQHPSGEAMTLRLEREGTRATALWWFELGDRAFSSHLYARRVLWSGWHLADRKIRLVLLESTSLQDPGALIAVAEREGWFAATPSAARTHR